MDFLFYDPGFGVVNSPGGIPFVNSSSPLPVFLHLALSLASGLLTRMGMSAEASCSVGFSLKEHLGGRRLGNKVEEKIP